MLKQVNQFAAKGLSPPRGKNGFAPAGIPLSVWTTGHEGFILARIERQLENRSSWLTIIL